MSAFRLESKFLLLWRVAQGPPLEREVKFHVSRRCRADFAHLASRTLIEIESGIFLPGGGLHSRGVGYSKDAEKYLEAVLAGVDSHLLDREATRNRMIARKYC